MSGILGHKNAKDFFLPHNQCLAPSFYPSTTSRADCRNFQFLKVRSMQFESYSSSQLLSSLHPSLGSVHWQRGGKRGDTPLNRPPALQPSHHCGSSAPGCPCWQYLMPEGWQHTVDLGAPLVGLLTVQISDLEGLALGGLPVLLSPAVFLPGCYSYGTIALAPSGVSMLKCDLGI